jgi:2-dehydropantoate 2-reductase
MRMAINPSARILVAGAGSVGCYLGGCLAAAGRDVTLLLRPALAAAIDRHGLRVCDLDGADRALDRAALRLATEPAALAAADIVLVTVKCGATAQMARLIARHAPPPAVVVSLQNGVANPDILRAELAPSQRGVAGMVPFNVVSSRREDEAPRFFRASSGTMRIARGIAGLRNVLDVAGAPVAEHADMPAVLWGKLLLNLNNALNALSDLPLAVQLADRRWRQLLAAQIDEALVILRRNGIAAARIEGVPPGALSGILRLPDFLFHRVARRMLAIDEESRSSMWEDLRLRRATEIDYLQGAIVRLAQSDGRPAPLTRRIVALVKGAEADGRGPPGLEPDAIARARSM